MVLVGSDMVADSCDAGIWLAVGVYNALVMSFGVLEQNVASLRVEQFALTQEGNER